jgi:tetratricopeptide (TPR) repeat protein
MFMVRRWTLAAVCTLTIASLMSLAGCAANKAPKEPPPIPDGPVTSLENPEGMKLKDMPAKANEPDIVERVVYYRSMYARSLRTLRDFYRTQGNQTKCIWAENELRQVWQIKPYSYIMDAEVPVTTAKPEASIEAADELFNEGITLLQEASDKDPKQNKDVLTRCLAKFKDLAAKYPNSDKADKACYYIGMIHYQYFPDDSQIALAWYKKAYTMNPKIPMPARYEAARIYDDRLKDRDKALEMYREVLRCEKFNKANYDYATNRLVALTTKGEDRAKKAMEPSYKQ